MRILFVTPSEGRPGFEYAHSVRENLGVEYLLAAVRSAGHHAESINGNLPSELSLDRVDLSNYDVIGFSLPFWDCRKWYVHTINRIPAAVGSRIIAGGHAATIGAEYFLQECPRLEGVVMGEGEATLLDLLTPGNVKEDIPGFYSRTGFRKRTLGQIDAVPFPARDELTRSVVTGSACQEALIASTRGCVRACSFCSIPTFYQIAHGPRWRERSVHNVCAELDQLVDQFAEVGLLSFTDDSFLGHLPQHRERAIDIARHIASKGGRLVFEIACRADSVHYETVAVLADSGLCGVYLGIESGVQRILDVFHKKTTVEQNLRAIETLARVGVGCDVGFIMFSPSITLDEVQQNLEFLQHILEAYPVFLHPAAVFRALCFYPTDLGRSAMHQDEDVRYDDARVGVVQAALELVWRQRFQDRYLQLEECAYASGHTQPDALNDLREVASEMIRVAIVMVCEAGKRSVADPAALAGWLS